MNFTITSDSVDQYNGRGVPGRYDAEFARLTPKNNCIVFDDFSEMEKVAQAMDGWIKRANLTGAKVKTTKAYRADGKPRCWLVYPPAPEKPKTEIRGNFRSEAVMTTEEIVDAARAAGFSSSEMMHRLAAFKRLIESTAAAEREACAKACESLFDMDDDSSNEAEQCAEAIRARSNK